MLVVNNKDDYLCGVQTQPVMFFFGFRFVTGCQHVSYRNSAFFLRVWCSKNAYLFIQLVPPQALMYMQLA